ncbi:MAG: glycosyltransferase [Cyanobacteriota bacterium]
MANLLCLVNNKIDDKQFTYFFGVYHLLNAIVSGENTYKAYKFNFNKQLNYSYKKALWHKDYHNGLISFTAIKPEETSSKRPIVIITDTWEPHIAGVTRGTKSILEALKAQGYYVEMITPNDLPGIKSKRIEHGRMKIALSPGNRKRIKKLLKDINPIGAYIVTEGPIGVNAVKEFKVKGQPYTSSYLTQWPQLISTYFREILTKLHLKKDKNKKGSISKHIENTVLKGLRWFHNSANATMVTAASMRDFLIQNGFTKVTKWSRAVDTEMFNPNHRIRDGGFVFKDYKTAKTVTTEEGKYKILGYIGRISPDKNLDILLKLSKEKDMSINNGNYKVVVVGPPNTLINMDKLRKEYPNVIFAGPKNHDELPQYFANFDVFVFPSQKDTFGIVQIESLACGTPVAAYFTNGPKDIIKSEKVGALEKDLNKPLNEVIKKALELNRNDCREYILNNPQYSWKKAAKDLADNMEKISDGAFNYFA